MTAESADLLHAFHTEQASLFQERMRQEREMEREERLLAEQRAYGFRDANPSIRRGSLLDSMCARISALEAENAHLRDISSRFTFLMSWLSQTEPDVLILLDDWFARDSGEDLLMDDTGGMMEPVRELAALGQTHARMFHDEGYLAVRDGIAGAVPGTYPWTDEGRGRVPGVRSGTDAEQAGEDGAASNGSGAGVFGRYHVHGGSSMGASAPVPSSRPDGILDRMCDRIGELERERTDLRQVAERFCFVTAWLAEHEPLILHSIVAGFGHDSQHRNLFLRTREYTPPFLAETVRVLNRDPLGSRDFDEARGWAEARRRDRDRSSGASGDERTGDPSEVDETEGAVADAGGPYDSEYGWLSPEGRFFCVPFGGHSVWAEGKAVELGYASEDDFFGAYADGAGDGVERGVLEMAHLGDDVMISHGWVLVHEPLHGVPRYHAGPRGLTKRQREYLFDMYVRIGRDDLACALYE